MKTINFDLENFLQVNKEYEENNYHTERLMNIAYNLDYKSYYKIFCHILDIQNELDEIPFDLFKFRYRMELRMYDEIERDYGKEIFNRIALNK